jgi:hypothetical protein
VPSFLLDGVINVDRGYINRPDQFEFVAKISSWRVGSEHRSQPARPGFASTAVYFETLALKRSALFELGGRDQSATADLGSRPAGQRLLNALSVGQHE